MVNTEDDEVLGFHWELESMEDTSMFAIGNIGQKGKFRMSVEGIIDDNKQELIDMIYPVGSIYMSVNDVNPATLFGGSWSKIEDTFLLASGSSFPATYDNSGVANNTGGSKDAVVVSHRHTPMENTVTYFVQSSGTVYGQTGDKRLAEKNSSGVYYVHTGSTSRTFEAHSATGYSGESGTDKNMPPYLVVNIWKRIG